jgi:hypothetical protein
LAAAPPRQRQHARRRPLVGEIEADALICLGRAGECDQLAQTLIGVRRNIEQHPALEDVGEIPDHGGEHPGTSSSSRRSCGHLEELALPQRQTGGIGTIAEALARLFHDRPEQYDRDLGELVDRRRVRRRGRRRVS